MQVPPSQFTSEVASFVVQPPSHALGGSNGTPASPSLGHKGEGLAVTVSGRRHSPVGGAQEHAGQANWGSGIA
jgi:hypothetical protein